MARMKRVPSPEDVRDMIGRGYDRSGIESEHGSGDRWEILQSILLSINQAFSGVLLGNGVSLQEARRMDDHSEYLGNDDSPRKVTRPIGWDEVSCDELSEYFDAYSFLDAEGIRFYLPALMSCDLLALYEFGVADRIFSGVQDDVRFQILNAEQRRAVRSYLEYARFDPKYRLRSQQIEDAIGRGLWD